jgi:trans-aconitate methyltransferase
MSVTHWDTSANAYHAEVENITFYRETNRELIAAGQIRPEMVVVDLGCGTGLTTRSILNSCRNQIFIYAVDQSQEMLAQARKCIQNSTVRFIQAGADHFAHDIPEKVDRVFCNAAFFHFSQPETVLEEIHQILKPEGQFLFNIPDQDFSFGDGKPSEMRQVVASCLNRPNLLPDEPRYTEKSITTLAATKDFTVVDYRIIEIPIYPKDLLRFYSIPHVGARWFPDHSPKERTIIFSNAFSTLPPNKAFYYRWSQFILVAAFRK